MNKPFKHGDKVFYLISKGTTNAPLKRSGRIVDSFYQHKTLERREGWRVLLIMDDIDHCEKYYDDLEIDIEI